MLQKSDRMKDYKSCLIRINSGATSGSEFDGFEAFLGDWKLPNFSAIQCQNMSFYWISSKIDGFENHSLKIDGFGRTHRTHADEAPECQLSNMFTKELCFVCYFNVINLTKKLLWPLIGVNYQVSRESSASHTHTVTTASYFSKNLYINNLS